MGNVYSANQSGPELENGCDWDFVGRKREIKELGIFLLKSQVVEIYGMMQIGQSRLLKAWFKETHGQIKKNKSSTLLLYFDFNICHKNKSISECIKSASRTFSSTDNNLLDNSEDLTELAKSFIDHTNAFRKNSEMVFFLDNLHFLNKKELEHLQSFIKLVTKEPALKFVLSTNEKIMSTAKGFVSYELGVLTEEDTLELLHVITENHYREDYKEKVYMDTIARLCEGLPLATMLAGTELKADNYFLEPKEMVELLFINRMKALCPDVYPEEEKVSVYNKAIEKAEDLGPYFAEFIQRITENTTGNTLATDEVVEAVADNKVTRAMTKKNLVRLHQMGIFSNLQRKHFQLHGVMRECSQMEFLLATVEQLPEDEKEEYEERIYKNMTENLERAGLKVTEDVLKDPKKLEEMIKNMSANIENQEDEIDSNSECSARDTTDEITNSFTTIDSSRSESIANNSNTSGGRHSHSIGTQDSSGSSNGNESWHNLSITGINGSVNGHTCSVNENCNICVGDACSCNNRQEPDSTNDPNIHYPVQESGDDFSLVGPPALSYMPVTYK